MQGSLCKVEREFSQMHTVSEIPLENPVGNSFSVGHILFIVSDFFFSFSFFLRP